jgi:hypothetical protein
MGGTGAVALLLMLTSATAVCPGLLAGLSIAWTVLAVPGCCCSEIGQAGLSQIPPLMLALLVPVMSWVAPAAERTVKR